MVLINVSTSRQEVAHGFNSFARNLGEVSDKLYGTSQVLSKIRYLVDVFTRNQVDISSFNR
jgi:hypothetical protein